MVDELLSRRSSFRTGKSIRLADGQRWTFPSPNREWSDKAHSDLKAYDGLIRSINEAEDHSEQLLAELSFAIFLLDQNYQLSPGDYQQLLDFGSETGESIDWQVAIHQLTQEHLHLFSITSNVLHQAELISIPHGLASRLRTWLRTFMPLRWRFFGSRSY